MSFGESKYVSIGDLLTSGSGVVTRIAEGHLPPCQSRQLLTSSDGELSYQREKALRLPAIDLFLSTGIELHSDFTPYRDGLPVTSDRLFPDYVQRYFKDGLVRGFANVEEVREVDAPVFCVSHFNMRTYGHFLLEVLPKVLLVKELQQAGLKIPIVFPSDAGPIFNIVTQICGSDGVLPYESRREILRPQSVIFPSMMISPDYRGHMHNVFVSLIRQLALQYSITPSTSMVPGPRLFLSRSKWRKGYRTAANEDELYAIAAEYGFELVHPQDLTWSDQVRMFYGASHVISAYDSALHGTLFCQAGTKVISLGRVNDLQNGIAASLCHEIDFLHPVKGEISLYDPFAPKRQFYEIDPMQLRSHLDGVFTG